MNAHKLIVTLFASLVFTTAPAAETGKTNPSEQDGVLVLENALLRVAVSPIGARVVSLRDKVRQREDVKNLPYVGGLNQVRYGQTLNLDDTKDRFELSLSKLPDGSQKLVAVAKVLPTADKPTAATVAKEYVLAAGSSRLRLAVEIRNESSGEFGLIPWVRNLILRGGDHEQTEEAHMTENGAFITGQPLPSQRDKAPSRGDVHYFPASNWSSRVVLPGSEEGNTLVAVTRPEDMFKIYNWHRGVDFTTLEVIAQPIFAKPGASCRWDYSMVWAPPIRNIVHVSTEVVVGVSPHPTWLAPDTKELSLEIAATTDLAGLTAHATLVALGQPEKTLREYDFTLPKLSPREVTRHQLAVNLENIATAQLRISFQRDGRPLDSAIIPLVIGRHAEAPVVFTKQTKAQGRLRQIQPQVHHAKQVFACDAFDAFSHPAAQRCFREDTFQATGTGPLQLNACAGEFESLQLVFMPKGKSDDAYQISGTELIGPGAAKATCEAISDFIYVPTKTPSGYNALYPLGEYPEALLPVKQLTLKPAGSHPVFITWRVPREAMPGRYRGSVTLTRGADRHVIPVELNVWNIQLPLRGRWMEFASSLKGNTLAEARHADGTPYSKQEQLDAIVDMHLKYRLTPCDSGLAGLLLKGDHPAFEKEMRKFVDAGATKIFLGITSQLLKSHGERIPEIEQYLKAKGWADYFFVRPGFDEVASDQVLKVKAALEEWKKVSSVPTMETYYHDDGAKEIFGLLDIWSRSSIAPLFDERIKAGDRFWRVNAMPGLLEPEPWESGRKRFITMWDMRFTGSYNWTVKAWSGVTKWGEDYWCDNGVGNLSAVLMWPHETGILSTIRLEAMRDGLEDNAMFWMLREKVEALAGKNETNPTKAAALARARALCSGGPLAPQIKSAADLERLRIEVGETLSALNTK